VDSNNNSRSDRSSSLLELAADRQQQFLRFSLSSGMSLLVEIDRVVELISIPIERVVPMPHLPPAVKGVYNWRGEILWIVDLSELLGSAATPQSYRNLQPTIVMSDRATEERGFAAAEQDRSQATIGFIVGEIAEIEYYDAARIQSPLPDWIDPDLAKWLRGWWESTSGEIFLILDVPAIFDRADIHTDL
jgi:positive phototaxis protein PixI